MGSSSEAPVKPAYPFLGFPVNGLQKIILLAPNHTDVSEVRCDLIVGKSVIATKVSRFRDPIVRLYEFEFSGLRVGCNYQYQFSSDEGSIELGEGLSSEDLNFIFHDRLTEADATLLVSCNGVKDFHERGLSPFAMWERMLDEVNKLPERPRLIINGGDQYYQDSIETIWIKQLSDDNFPKVRDDFKRASLQNALEHMNSPAYRKLMAQIPSIAMLDDHDITDGAGGRPEYFDGDNFTPEYRNFATVQIELFDLIQSSRNPAPILKTGLTGFSFVVDLGESALVALDLRTQKNARKKQLMEPDTEKAVLSAIENLTHKNVMILIPVVPFRNARVLEGVLLSFARVFAGIAAKYFPKGGIGAKLKTGMEYFAGLEDDLLDALSSEANVGFLARLLRSLAKGARKGVRYTVLSGDIHTGGTVESRVTVDGFSFKLPIVVSSPIGYQPMHYIVEAMLKERRVISFAEDGVGVRALIDAFTTQRNFILFYPAKIGTSARNEACWIYQEEVSGAKLLLVDGWLEPASAVAKPIMQVPDRPAVVKT